MDNLRMINFLMNTEVHDSWKPFICNDIKSELQRIEHAIGLDFTPSVDKVLRFLSIDLCTIKVIIMGQDPYPQENAATGRAFEVGNLISWNQKFRQASLKNIIKLLYKSYFDSLLSFSTLQNKIENKDLHILTPDKLFKAWEKQGVLLLNTYLTCKLNHPNSHRNLWKMFSDKLIKYIHSVNPDITWFLWGNEAKSILNIINPSKKFVCDHPMICNSIKPSSFINSRCFLNTKSEINWLGHKKLI